MTEHHSSSPVNIRPASKADLPTIEEILRATVQDPYGSGYVDENEVQMELRRINRAFDFPEEGDLLIAEDGRGQGLGFAFFGKPDPILLSFTCSNPATTLEFRLLYLAPSQRSRGVGSQLVAAVEQRAKNMGMLRIELTCGPRYIAIGTGTFHLKQGYTLVGTMPTYFEGRYPASVFQKDLY